MTHQTVFYRPYTFKQTNQLLRGFYDSNAKYRETRYYQSLLHQKQIWQAIKPCKILEANKKKEKKSVYVNANISVK